ncbi:phosphotransferase family protein [Sphaerisporangium aureirubrum]|uniref:Phosphotransferase family protein n=1 Tax=Sphaerisporangium aureirubrum TaxID=1544736 RepID=A0ABW1NIV0_9ACTN
MKDHPWPPPEGNVPDGAGNAPHAGDVRDPEQILPPTEQDVLDVVRAHLPGVPARSVALLGEGMDNVAYEVGGELVVRYGKDPSARVDLIARETGLLRVVAEISPLPVPTPVFTDLGRGCWAYAKLPGVPLLSLPPSARAARTTAIAAVLGGFLAALHAVPAGRVASLAGRDDDPLVTWRDEAAELHPSVGDVIPAAHRGAVEAFLTAPPPDDAPSLVFSHNDLGIEHVLMDPATGAVTGVIDWTDAALTDPAYDLGLLYRDLGPAALAAALKAYRPPAPGPLRERAVFYARCSVLEDLAYGVRTGLAAYTDKSLAALAWLFPPPSPGV